MHYRIAAFLLGCLILGSLFMMFVATQNFQTVDRVLASAPPQAQQEIQTLGRTSARNLLHYFAGEENQLFFTSWETTQLILAAALTGFLFFGAHDRLLAGVAAGLLVLVGWQHFQITPEMVALGRSIDIQASPPDRFWKLHALYGIVEVLKLVTALTLGGLLLPTRQSRAQNTRNQGRTDNMRAELTR